ncbi:sulfatase-like hydrolase/transferase [Flammeovirga sp. SubArs3]|uniref:sulfatase-like hydrolase/transferase n=1 Tax=Flammeovirga sp. SubArs3 TaxID=2995316 RepID=UPI00248CC133|nr:sulfatase-like hydrolase/transferase [Flammeovirga sp. SubArs3]
MNFKIITFLLILTHLFPHLGTAENDKPNILWITFEDTSPHMIYNNQAAITPVMDKISEMGIQFNSAFSTATICSASRSAIITGMHATSIGTGNHRGNIPFPNFIKGFPTYLRDHGYYTSNNLKTDYNVLDASGFTNEAWNESSATATWKNRKPDQPFFSVFNLMYTHTSRKYVNSYSNYKKEVLDNLPDELKTKPEDAIVPPYLKDSEEMKEHFARIYNCINYTDYKIGEILDELEKDGLTESTIVFIYSDHGEAMPRGKGNGLNIGHQVPLYVYVPEKFKALVGIDNGTTSDRVISFEDLAATVLSLTGIKVPDYMEGVNFLAKNYTKEMYFGAKDAADEIRDITREVADNNFSYSRVYNTSLPEMKFKNYTGKSELYQTVRNDLWNGRLNDFQTSLFYDHRKYEKLYDTKNDPWEMNNLADDPQYKEQLEKMRDFCNQQILETRDLQFIPYGEMINIYLKTGLTPYEFKFDEDIYPLTKILPIANLSGKGKEVIEEQIEALNSDIDLVRYWAIYGLRNQLSNVIPYLKEVEEIAFDTQERSFIRIEAATILYQQTRNEKALELLQEYAKGEDLFHQWHSLRNIQDYFTNQNEFTGLYEEVIDNLPASDDIDKLYRSIRNNVQTTCKGALYMINERAKNNIEEEEITIPETNGYDCMVEEENFESISLSENWSIINGTEKEVFVENKHLILNKLSSENSIPTIQYQIATELDDNYELNFTFSAGKNHLSNTIDFISSEGNYILSLLIGGDNRYNIFYTNSIEGEQVTTFLDENALLSDKFEKNKNYRVKLSIYEGKSLDIYINGLLVEKGVKVINEKIDKLVSTFSKVYKNEGTIYFDALNIKNKIDYQPLNDKISEAYTIIKAISVGTSVGDFPQTAVDTLLLNIDDATLIGKNCRPQYTVNATIDSLDQAIKAFLLSEVKEEEENVDPEQPPLEGQIPTDIYDFKSSWFLGPNPFDSYFFVKFQEAKSGRISIYDLLGNILYQEFITNQKSIDIKTLHLQTGVYIIKFESPTDYFTSKIQKL